MSDDAEDVRKQTALIHGTRITRTHLDAIMKACIDFESQGDDRFDPEINMALKREIAAASKADIPENYIQRVIQFARQGYTSLNFKTHESREPVPATVSPAEDGMGSLLPIDTLGAMIVARIERGDMAVAKAEDHYKAAGIHLLEAKARLKRPGEILWSAFLFSRCKGLCQSRAYELMAIADGRTTLEEIRSKARERKARHDTKNKAARAATDSVTNGNSPEETLRVPPVVVRLRTDVKELERRLADSEAENERLKAENVQLKDELAALRQNPKQGYFSVDHATGKLVKQAPPKAASFPKGGILDKWQAEARDHLSKATRPDFVPAFLDRTAERAAA